MLGDLALNRAYEIPFAGWHHDRQIVDLIKSRIRHTHTFKLLIHRQTQTAPDLLQFGNPGIARCQLAQRENIRVIPPLLQCPHREDKAQIGIKRQQLFLLLKNQLDRLFLALFAMRAGKIALMHPSDILCRANQIRPIRRVKIFLGQHGLQLRPIMPLERLP